MSKTGPQSELDTLAAATVAASQVAPVPPPHMTQASRDVWEQVTSSMPATWFKDSNLPLLEQYCEHVVSAREIQELINTMQDAMRAMRSPPANFKHALAGTAPFDLKDYRKLLELREKESRAILALARSMRLSQQAQYSKDKSQAVPTKAPPWEQK